MDAAYDANPIVKNNLNFRVHYRQINTNYAEYRFYTLGYDSIVQGTGQLEGRFAEFMDITVLGKIYNNPLYFFYTNPNPYDWIRNAYYVPKVGIVKY